MSGTVVEIVQFKLQRGVDEATFMKASDGAQSFLNRARGFVNRELARTENGLNWVDIVKWRARADADNAAKTAMKDPDCMKFFALIDKKSMKTQYMELTRTYH
ncbi:MAG: hypothetical protein ACREBU_15585 [Nitrososphaera sp.]